MNLTNIYNMPFFSDTGIAVLEIIMLLTSLFTLFVLLFISKFSKPIIKHIIRILMLIHFIILVLMLLPAFDGILSTLDNDDDGYSFIASLSNIVLLSPLIVSAIICGYCYVYIDIDMESYTKPNIKNKIVYVFIVIGFIMMILVQNTMSNSFIPEFIYSAIINFVFTLAIFFNYSFKLYNNTNLSKKEDL